MLRRRMAAAGSGDEYILKDGVLQAGHSITQTSGSYTQGSGEIVLQTRGGNYIKGAEALDLTKYRYLCFNAYRSVGGFGDCAALKGSTDIGRTDFPFAYGTAVVIDLNAYRTDTLYWRASNGNYSADRYPAYIKDIWLTNSPPA